MTEKRNTFIKAIALALGLVMAICMFQPLQVIAAEENVSVEMLDAIDSITALAGGYGSNGKFLAEIEPHDPNAIKIYTPQDLDNVRNNLNGSYVLMNDIDLGDAEWAPIGDGDNSFSGIFDGQGYIIHNMKITGERYRFNGLFGYATGAIIKNVGLQGTYIDVTYSASVSYSGGICGVFEKFNNTTNAISNCYNMGIISVSAVNSSSAYAGGISGQVNEYYYATTDIVNNCYNTASVMVTVSGSSMLARNASVGGISGETVRAIISNCYNNGDIAASASFTYACAYAGGISGYSPFSSINNSYNEGNISALSIGLWNAYTYAGGIGSDAQSIINSYNTGNVSASANSALAGTYAGGINGYRGAISSEISQYINCYNVGEVSAYSNGISSNNIGGIVGMLSADSTFNNSYCLDLYSSEHGTLLTESDMKIASNFVGFDFEEVWDISSSVNNGYPFLKGMIPSGGGSSGDQMDISKYFIPADNGTHATDYTPYTNGNISFTDQEQQAFVNTLLETRPDDERNEKRDKIIDLLFNAEYRPRYFGGADWVYKNGYKDEQTNKNKGLAATISDKKLGDIKIAPALGCLSYANYARAYIYNTNGVTILPSKDDWYTDITESKVRNTLNENAKCGDVISLTPMHSYTYLAEKKGGEGFYCLNYDGGDQKYGIQLYYVEYSKFIKMATQFQIKSVAEKDSAITTLTGKFRCPIDISIFCNGEELNSATGKYSTSFGEMTVGGTSDDKEIDIELNYGLDYEFKIVGTNTGFMDFTISYDDGTSANSRQFQGIGITPTTIINIYDFVAYGGLTVYVDLNGNGVADEIWYSEQEDLSITTPNQDLINEYLYYLSFGNANLKVASDKSLVTKDDYFNLKTEFVNLVNSNTLIVTYNYDGSKFDYQDFSPANGIELINTVKRENSVSLTLGKFDGYGISEIGNALFSVKDNADLKQEDNIISVTAEYVYKDESDFKTIEKVSADVVITTTDGKNYSLIDLSNLIDLFGVTSENSEWETAKFYDFNSNGTIDIYDIAYMASTIK